MNTKPLVSVLMTAYNAESYIDKAIQSIVDQTYKNLELIVVDDGSADNTYKIARSFMAKDKRVKVFKMKKNSGPSVASNFGMKHVHGHILARMDADDISFSDRIEKQVTYLLKHPKTIMIGGQCVLIDKEGSVVGNKNFPTTHKGIYNALFSINPIQHPSCMINMNLLPKGHELYHDRDVLAHDLELVFEMAQYGKLANLKDNVLYYRQYETSLSLKNPKKTFKATLGVRGRAVSEFGYVPSQKAVLVHRIQQVVMFVLPSEAIYPLFVLLRTQNAGDYIKALPAIFAFTKASIQNRLQSIKMNVGSTIFGYKTA